MRTLIIFAVFAFAALAEGPAHDMCGLSETGCIEATHEHRSATAWNGGAKHLPLIAYWCVEELPEEFKPAVERVRREILRNTHNVFLPPSNLPDAPQTVRWRVGDTLILGDVLAEAHYPWATGNEAGDVTFNARKDWSRYDIYSVALHEVLHALFGAGHLILKGTVLYPSYQGVLFRLTPPDVDVISRMVNVVPHPYEAISIR